MWKGQNMTKLIRYSLLIQLSLVVLLACDVKKNTFINRTYHSTTAQYNGYFNANLLLDDALTQYRNNYQENYYDLLPLEVYPSEEDVQDLYPAIDTAIAKCKKVIQDHSMPGSSKPSKKKEENNTFIDENWITIGVASYIRRDYELAMKNFKFIKKFYENDPSNYVGELWMARCNIAMKKYTEAGFNLDNINEVLEREAELKQRDIKERIEDFQERRKNDDPPPLKLPKSLRYDYELTVAELALIREDREKAIEHLTLAARATKKRPKRARVYYILGQLYEKEGKRQTASAYYSKVLKNNAPYEMQFSARLKRAFLGGDEKLIKELKKMLRDEKNAEYKDQIYYALAQIELDKNNEPGVFENLTYSAFYSTKNTRQKAMAYEQMADLKFAKKKYVPAQKYYDSCANVMPEDYPNGEAIRQKAEKLSDLVLAVETAQFEDSVQMIAGLSESEREDFIKDVIKDIKKKEKERKRKEAEKLAALQKSTNFNQTQGGNKWYFRNPKTRQEGYDEFQKLWGQRENEDNWRRSEKTPVTNFDNIEDSLAQDQDSGPVPVDSLTVDQLLVDIPLTDSAMAESRKRLCKALYDAGIIYKDQLNETAVAANKFNEVVNKPYDSKYKLMSAFELYKINETSKPAIAAVNKQYIIGNYPDSDYANYLKDPDFFIKKRELESESEKVYVEALNRCTKGLYYPTMMEVNQFLAENPETALTPKYLLLKAMCQGQLNEDKKTLLPTLNQIIEQYPGSEEAARATEMKDIIENGYSENIEADFEDKSIYKYNDKATHYVIVFLPKEENSSLSKLKVSDFSREYFSRDNLKVQSKVYENDQSIILIEDFEGDFEAKEYVRVYKSTRKHLLDLQNAKIYPITQENLKVLYSTKKLKEYEDFYVEYY